MAVKQWFLQNGLLLNANKSEAMIAGTPHQLQLASVIKTVPVAGVNLPVQDKLKLLGVIVDSRLSFDSHVRAVVRSCSYHAQAIRHICHLLTPELAKELAYSLINSRLDYCNSLLYRAPAGVIKQLQRVKTMQREPYCRITDDVMLNRCL